MQIPPWLSSNAIAVGCHLSMRAKRARQHRQRLAQPPLLGDSELRVGRCGSCGRWIRVNPRLGPPTRACLIRRSSIHRHPPASLSARSTSCRLPSVAAARSCCRKSLRRETAYCLGPL
eukprot:16070_1